VIAPIARNVADALLAFEVMTGPDARDSTLVESGDAGSSDLRMAFSPKLALDTPVDPVIAERLEAVVEHLGERGLRIVRRDPIWPPGATEEALMPLQHAGLAGLYGADFQKDPSQFDRDVARQIERGLSLRGVEVTAALGASAAIRTAFAAFFLRVRPPAGPDRSLDSLAPCTTGPNNDRWQGSEPSGSRRLHAFRQSRTHSRNFNPLRPRRGRPSVRDSDHRAKGTRPDVAARGNAY
jgi:aspartyl-tRNA(Asn)/glutamyl-tRNA(Gln) amidotransferase subunit A